MIQFKTSSKYLLLKKISEKVSPNSVNPFSKKIDILIEKPLFKCLLLQLDSTDLSLNLTAIKDSPVAFMDHLAHTILLPAFHNAIRQFQLDPIDIQLVDNAFSKTDLKLTTPQITIPNPPETFRIRSTTDMEFNHHEKLFSETKITTISSLSIRDLLLYIKSDFEYIENSLFISIQRKGSFQAKVNQLNLVVSIILEKSHEKIIFSGPNEQKCRVSGFGIEFSPKMNESELLNKLSSTFNGDITLAINKALEKQLVSVMKEVAVDLNDFLAIYYNNREK